MNGNPRSKKTSKQDSSPNDIFRLFNGKAANGRNIGCYMVDLDCIGYKFDANGKRKAVALWDFKHNGLTDNCSPTINLSQESILAGKDLAEQLECPFFIVITFTKEGEQPIPMFFCMPMNHLAMKKMQEFLLADVNIERAWMSPRRMAQFNFFLSGKAEPSNGEWTTLSQEETKYELPKIVCSVNKKCCCFYCKLSERNTKIMRR